MRQQDAGVAGGGEELQHIPGTVSPDSGDGRGRQGRLVMAGA